MRVRRMVVPAAVLLSILLLPAPAFAAKDSDGDGMPDRWERIHGTDPKHRDANRDPDFDELTNVQEYKHRTFPYEYDSDFDGLGDGDEVNVYHSKPRDYDSDDDGMTDGEEIFDGSGQTRINNPDTDGDGVLDGDEDTDGDGVQNEDEDDLFDCDGSGFRDYDGDFVADEDENDFGTSVLLEDTDEDGTIDGKEDFDGDGILNEDEDDIDADECNGRVMILSSLKNAATAEESFATLGNGYTTEVADLEGEGFIAGEDVVITIPHADSAGYCIEARHEELPNLVDYYSSDEGRPLPGTCP